jgi:hypothetical protein
MRLFYAEQEEAASGAGDHRKLVGGELMWKRWPTLR